MNNIAMSIPVKKPKKTASLDYISYLLLFLAFFFLCFDAVFDIASAQSTSQDINTSITSSTEIFNQDFDLVSDFWNSGVLWNWVATNGIFEVITQVALFSATIFLLWIPAYGGVLMFKWLLWDVWAKSLYRKL